MHLLWFRVIASKKFDSKESATKKFTSNDVAFNMSLKTMSLLGMWLLRSLPNKFVKNKPIPKTRAYTYTRIVIVLYREEHTILYSDIGAPFYRQTNQRQK